MASSLTWRLVTNRWPCNRSTFNDPNSGIYSPPPSAEVLEKHRRDGADPWCRSACRDRHQTRRGCLVDPGDDGAVQVSPQIQALATAALVRAEASGDELIAAARARGSGDLALEHDGAQGLLGGVVGRLHTGMGDEAPQRGPQLAARPFARAVAPPPRPAPGSPRGIRQRLPASSSPPAGSAVRRRVHHCAYHQCQRKIINLQAIVQVNADAAAWQGRLRREGVNTYRTASRCRRCPNSCRAGSSRQ
jgi:hypothetical protein